MQNDKQCVNWQNDKTDLHGAKGMFNNSKRTTLHDQLKRRKINTAYNLIKIQKKNSH